MGQNTGFEHANAPSPGMVRKLKAEATFADACLSDNADNPTVTFDRVCQLTFECGKLIFSSDQAAQAGVASERLTGRRIAQSFEPEDVHGIRDPPNVL